MKNPSEYLPEDYVVDFPSSKFMVSIKDLKGYFLNITIRNKCNISILLEYYDEIKYYIPAAQLYEKFYKLSKRNFITIYNFNIESLLNNFIENIMKLEYRQEFNKKKENFEIIEKISETLPNLAISYLRYGSKEHIIMQKAIFIKYSEESLDYKENSRKNWLSLRESMNLPIMLYHSFEKFQELYDSYEEAFIRMRPYLNPRKSISDLLKFTLSTDKQEVLLKYLQGLLNHKNEKQCGKKIKIKKLRNNYSCNEDLCIKTIAESLKDYPPKFIKEYQSLFTRSLSYLNFDSTVLLEKLFIYDIEEESDKESDKENPQDKTKINQLFFSNSRSSKYYFTVIKATRDVRIISKIFNSGILLASSISSSLFIPSIEIILQKGSNNVLIQLLRELKRNTENPKRILVSCLKKFLKYKGKIIFTKSLTFQDLFSNLIKFYSEEPFDEAFTKSCLKKTVSYIYRERINLRVVKPCLKRQIPNKDREFMNTQRIKYTSIEIFELIFSLWNQKHLIDSLLISTMSNFQYILQAIDNQEFALQIFLNCAYHGLSKKLKFLLQNYQICRDHKEKAEKLAVIGRNWDKVALSQLEKLTIDVCNLFDGINYHLTANYERNNEETQELLKITSIGALKLMAFFGEEAIIEYLPTVSSDNYIELILFSLNGLTQVKRYHNKYLNIFKIQEGYKIIFDFFPKPLYKLRKNSLNCPDADAEVIIKLCMRFKYFSLLVSFLPHTDFNDSSNIANLYYQISISYISISLKLSLLERMIKNNYPPDQFLRNCILSNSTVIRNYKILAVFIKNCPAVIYIFKESIADLIGKYLLMRNIQSFSMLGIASYGNAREIEKLFDSDSSMINWKIDMCRIAIKRRNRSTIQALFNYFIDEDYELLMTIDNCEVLFDLAFYILDDIASIIFSFLSVELLIHLSTFRRNGFSAYEHRLLISNYSQQWEPLNFLFTDISNNRYFICIYLQKLIQKIFNYNFTIFSDLDDFSRWEQVPLQSESLSQSINQRSRMPCDNEQDVINFIHKSIIKSPLDDKIPAIQILLALHLYPSECDLKENIKKNKINLAIKYLADPDYTVLEKFEIKTKLHCAKMERINYSSDLTFMLLQKLCLSGDPLLLKIDWNAYMRLEEFNILLANGNLSQLLIYMKSSTINWKLNSVFLDLDDTISVHTKETLLLAYVLCGILGVKCIKLILSAYTQDNFARVKDFHLCLVKAFELIAKVSEFYTGIVVVQELCYSTLLKQIIKFQRLFFRSLSAKGLRIYNQECLKEILENCCEKECILVYSAMTKCISECMEYYCSLGKVKIYIDANTDISYETINDELKVYISLNFEKTNNDIIKFNSFSFPYIERLSYDSLARMIGECLNHEDLRLDIKEIPSNPAQFYAMFNYFDNEEISLQDMISEILTDTDSLDFEKLLNMEEDNSEFLIRLEGNRILLNTKNAEYPSNIIRSFSKLALPETIVIKERTEDLNLPAACDTIYYYYTIQSVLCKQNSLQNDDENNYTAFVIDKYLFYPYALYKIKDIFTDFLFRYLFCIELACEVELNYEEFYIEIIAPQCTFFKIDPYTAFMREKSNFDSIFLSLLKLVSNLHELFSSLKGIFITFTKDKPIFSIRLLGMILIFDVGFKSKEEPTDELFEYFLPDPDHIIEDFMIFCLTPAQICEYILDYSAIRVVLEKENYKGFSFVMDWDSITKFFIPYLRLGENYRGAIRVLKCVSREIQNMTSYSYFEKLFLEKNWHEIKNIINFRHFPNSIAVKKILEEEIFDDGDNYKNFRKRFNLSDEIHNPYPDLLSISTEENDYDILLDISDIDKIINNNSIKAPKQYTDKYLKLSEHPPKKKNKLLLRIKNKEFTAKLKHHFFYYFFYNENRIHDYFTKNINATVKCRKRVYNSKTHKLHKRPIKKKISWVLILDFQWDNFFKRKKFGLSQGRNLSKNLFEKIEYFFTILETLFNFISTNESFYTISGNTFIRPKASLMKKLIIKYFSRIIISIHDQDSLEFNDGIPTLFLDPMVSPVDSNLLMERSIKIISDYILSREISNFNIENTTVKYEKIPEISFLPSLERLALFSQIPLLIKATKIAKEIYCRNEYLRLTVDLNYSNKIVIKGMNNGSQPIISVLLGLPCYNSFSLSEFGEGINRVTFKYRPLNSLLLFKNCWNKIFRESENSSILVPVDPSKLYIKKRIISKKYAFAQAKQSIKSFLISYYRKYPVMILVIGYPLNTFSRLTVKYSLFCTKSLNAPFKPIIKPSQAMKIKLCRKKLNATSAKLNSEFNFYLVSSTQLPSINILNKNTQVGYKIAELEGIVVIRDRFIFYVSFTCSLPGDYFVYSEEKPVASDFIVNVQCIISAEKCKIDFDKFKNIFIVKLFSIEGKPFKLRSFGSSIENSCFDIGSQRISMSITDNSSNVYQMKTKVTAT